MASNMKHDTDDAIVSSYVNDVVNGKHAPLKLAVVLVHRLVSASTNVNPFLGMIDETYRDMKNKTTRESEQAFADRLIHQVAPTIGDATARLKQKLDDAKASLDAAKNDAQKNKARDVLDEAQTRYNAHVRSVPMSNRRAVMSALALAEAMQRYGGNKGARVEVRNGIVRFVVINDEGELSENVEPRHAETLATAMKKGEALPANRREWLYPEKKARSTPAERANDASNGSAPRSMVPTRLGVKVDENGHVSLAKFTPTLGDEVAEAILSINIDNMDNVIQTSLTKVFAAIDSVLKAKAEAEMEAKGKELEAKARGA